MNLQIGNSVSASKSVLARVVVVVVVYAKIKKNAKKKRLKQK